MIVVVILVGWVVASLLTAVAWSRLMRRTRSLFELPRDDQVTVHVERVTCRQTEPVIDGGA